ncbi:MAG: hypothetical protein GDA48_14925 [Hormoscilla sp. GM102CHS1]|nr:hypothetical protein [Hormoscilla sp. GM102CHS1]
MAYSAFTTIAKARETFNLTVEEMTHLFTDIEPIAPSDYLKMTLTEAVSPRSLAALLGEDALPGNALPHLSGPGFGG